MLISSSRWDGKRLRAGQEWLVSLGRHLLVKFRKGCFLVQKLEIIKCSAPAKDDSIHKFSISSSDANAVHIL